MSNVFTLDSLREEIEKEYAPLVLEADGRRWTLVSLLRLDKTTRDRVVAHLEALDPGEDGGEPSEDETTAAVEAVLHLVTKDQGESLVRSLRRNGEPDLLMLMKVLARWREATQPGEADTSPT